MNLYFIIFLIIVVIVYKNRKEKYLDKINSLKDTKEDFVGNNTLDINYIENEKYIGKKSLYTLDIDPNEKDSIPIIYTNYKYSLEYKLGYELSRIFRIRFQESKNLYHNINELSQKKNAHKN